MKKIFFIALLAFIGHFSSFALVPISGPTVICQYGTTVYNDSPSVGGVWYSSNAGVASIDSMTGYASGITPGTTIISYTLGGVTETLTLTVNPSPSAISGPSSVCVGSTITLTDATTGGTWFSGSTLIASVGSVSGVVTGLASGTAGIYYSVGGCSSAAHYVTVGTSTTFDSISGPTSVCVGSTITLTDLTSGGVWTSSSTGIATIGSSSGVVTGVSAGTDVIDYTLTSSCGGTVSVGYTITVMGATSAGTISGLSSVVAGSTITLSDGVSGGVWSSSNTAVATISGGVVTGVSAGTTTISYSVSGCTGTANTTYVVTVTPFTGISGNVLFTGASYYGNVKVWLIHFNPSTNMLTAIDSQVVYSSGSSASYSFPGLSTDSFRVKAYTDDTIFSGTGYIPTYHDSSFYWNSANVIYHTSGTADINENIWMAYGTVTTGPGFIAGNVTTGANRGTSTGIPAVGLLVYITNAAGQELQQVYTDASGNYSFSNLPNGTYNIHPEAINYKTYDYTSITLSTGSESMSAANFIQHTKSMTITPIMEGISNVNPSVSALSAFPNPTGGKLNVQWMETANETGNLVITDITGREVFKTTLNMNAGAGGSLIDLSALNSGLYMISVKSASINYINKLEIKH